MHKRRINIFIGAYGSGKTEVVVNYALKLKAAGKRVGLVDLDIVNPFFRSRELKGFLKKEGIELVATEDRLEAADFPALSPRIFALLQNTAYQVVFDVGGDPVGARALGRYEDYFLKEGCDLWWVINPYRPGCSNPEQLSRLAQDLEANAKLKITGIVDNANLGKETTPKLRKEGSRIVDETAKILGLPVLIRTTLPPLEIGADGFGEVMKLKLYMTPPWDEEEKQY